MNFGSRSGLQNGTGNIEDNQNLFFWIVIFDPCLASFRSRSNFGLGKTPFLAKCMTYTSPYIGWFSWFVPASRCLGSEVVPVPPSYGTWHSWGPSNGARGTNKTPWIPIESRSFPSAFNRFFIPMDPWIKTEALQDHHGSSTESWWLHGVHIFWLIPFFFWGGQTG